MPLMRVSNVAFVLAVMTAPLCASAAEDAAQPHSAEETVRSFKLPNGFTATVFAAEPDVVQPIGFCFDDRGRLWVAESHSYPNWSEKGRDRIVIFEDADGDGGHDKRTVFYDRLNYVTGIEYGFGGVFVVSAPHLLFIPDENRDDKPDAEPQPLLDGFGHQGVHNLVNGCTWGPDGWLYGGHGGSSSGHIGKPGAPESQRTFFDGGVWRYHPVKHVFESFMEGTTNPWGVDFDEHGQAFISNSVTPHLYHVIQGAHVQRRRESPLSRHAYAVIDTIADHKHWVGSDWTESRGGKPEQVTLGGGHAHSGCMVYLGGAFPPEYRGRIFMNNIHGDRVNVDHPRLKGSGFTASHAGDFLVSGDPWFQGLQLKYGPDGSVYLSDWYDTGECHTRKPHEKSGRIYRISYSGSRANTAPADLARVPDGELVALQRHPNEWHTRRARRLLHERATSGDLDAAVVPGLMRMLTDATDARTRLRALWALHVVAGLSQEHAIRLLDDPEQHVRAWAVQLLAEDRELSGPAAGKLVQQARSDPSPRVRLYLASAAQRLPPTQRWPLLEALSARDEDAADPNIPLMTWYALEPLVAEDPRRAMRLASRSRFPRLREFVARRAAAGIPRAQTAR